MFTGIIEEVGRIANSRRQGDAMVLTISCRKVLEGLKIGDSVSVSGVCLTVTAFTADHFQADVMVETVTHTNLADMTVGSRVNLERALQAGDRFGGHFVSGHVDGVATITERRAVANAVYFRFRTAEALTAFMVSKGSVAVNGISLTLVEVTNDSFSVSIIPHTLQVTNLGALTVGDRVNVECDLLGKYIIQTTNRVLAHPKNTPPVTVDFLRENGFA